MSAKDWDQRFEDSRVVGGARRKDGPRAHRGAGAATGASTNNLFQPLHQHSKHSNQLHLPPILKRKQTLAQIRLKRLHIYTYIHHVLAR